MKILVVPDIHCAPNLGRVEAIITAEGPDLTVFLGDYFDRSGDTPADNVRTAHWLMKSLKKPHRVHLLGNHDVQYSDRRPWIVRSGFTMEKYVAIRGTMRSTDWVQLKLAHWEGDWLFTHAGWSKHHCPDDLAPSEMRAFLKAEIDAAYSADATSKGSWVFGVGKVREGDREAGGLLWCDAREFHSIPGLNQVFGHTRGRLGNIAAGPEQAWIIDTGTRDGVRNVLRIVDGVVTVLDIA